MSTVYFHSPTGDAKLRGSERAWLNHITQGPAASAWHLDRMSRGFERAVEILAWVPEKPDNGYGSNYLHQYLREAVDEDRRNKAAYEQAKGLPISAVGPTSYDRQHRLVDALKLSLRVSGVDLHVAGRELHSSNVELNTCLAVGNDFMALAAKIHGWCESHAYIEGPDRAWVADVIARGLAAGVFRKGIWYYDGPGSATGYAKQWSSQGWEEVQALLRETDTEPVVMSFSVSDQFPNAYISNWMPPWPEGLSETWDALTEEQQIEREDRKEAWYELDADEQWRLALDGLRQRRPWARIAPDTLTEVTFGPPVTIYDLFAPDRDERIAAAFTEEHP